MVLTEIEEVKRASNFDLNNTSTNAKGDSNERSSKARYETSLQSKSKTEIGENNALLLDVNQVKPEFEIDGNQSKFVNMNDLRDRDGKEETDPRNLEKGHSEKDNEPPDGGFRAWLIMIGSFIINGVLFSVINSYSVIYGDLNTRLENLGVKDPASKASLVGSLQLGTTFCMSPLAGILTNRIGIQMTTFLGGLIASLGMFTSSFLLDKVEWLYLTCGLMYGIGASLAYAPSLVILGHYFKRYLGLINGVVTAGSSIFTIVIPYLMGYILKHLHLKGLLMSIGGLTCLVMACAYLFKPINHNPRPAIEIKEKLQEKTLFKEYKSLVNVSVVKNTRYFLWATAMPIALLGYQVPYIHIGKFVETYYGKEADQKLPIMCLGITSGVGRLVFGYIADLPRVNRILLQQVSFICMGSLMMLMPFTTSYTCLIMIYLFMGLFDGCFISLLGPIAFEICGQKDANSAISLLLGFCAVPVTIGSLFAGFLYDRTGSYRMTFILSGVPPLVAAMVMFTVRCIKESQNSDSVDPAKQSLTNPPWPNDNTKAVLSPVASVSDVEKEKQRFEDCLKECRNECGNDCHGE